VLVTSYTRMKRNRAEPKELEPVEFFSEPEPLKPDLPDEELPGGAQTGIFLHEALEKVALGTFRRDSPFGAWRAEPSVQAVFRALARAHAVAPLHLEHAARMVHAALSAPLRLGGPTLEGGIARARRVVREMEFLYPFPERDPAWPAVALPGRVEVSRGYVKGFVDVVFEHAGRVYFGDWKSDLLPGYEPAELASHVQAHYRLQAQLYSLAMVKLLGLGSAEAFEARFGGIAYCFLRGMRPDDARAVHFERPGFVEIERWVQELARSGPGEGA
jgi:exodeoxyribonuclease V beta subunit